MSFSRVLRKTCDISLEVLGKRVTYWRVLEKLVASLWGSWGNVSRTGVLGGNLLYLSGGIEELRHLLGVLGKLVTSLWWSWGNVSRTGVLGGNLLYLSGGIEEMRHILGVLGKLVTY